MPDSLDFSKLTIVKYPAPVLRKPCKPIEEFGPQWRLLAEKMLNLMREARGVGLAAPQVGLSVRLFVCNPTGQPDRDRVFVNPVIDQPEGVIEAEEGCLSLPSVLVDIRRAARCRISALDVEGRPFQLQGADLEARIWQHETDHLDGRLILDYMSEISKLENRRILRQLEEDFKNARSRK